LAIITPGSPGEMDRALTERGRIQNYINYICRGGTPWESPKGKGGGKKAIDKTGRGAFKLLREGRSDVRVCRRGRVKKCN